MRAIYFFSGFAFWRVESLSEPQPYVSIHCTHAIARAKVKFHFSNTPVITTKYMICNQKKIKKARKRKKTIKIFYFYK